MRRASIRELSADVIRNCASANEVLGVTSNGALLGVLVPLTQDVLSRLTTSDTEEERDDVDADDEIDLTDLRQLLRDASSSGTPSGFSRVSVREISGARLTQASSEGAPLVVTSDRVTVAVFLPLASGWVDRLVEESVTRFLADRPTSSVSPLPSGAAGVSRAELMEITSGQMFLNQRVIGIRIVGDARHDRRRIVGVLTDRLARTNLEQVELALTRLDETYVLDRIRTLVHELSSRAESTDDIVGVGMEIGGHVYHGRVVRSTNIHWDDFPFADRLSEAILLPVALENDANALAILEQLQAIIAENFAVVLLTHLGVGCGLVLNGKLYRGASGTAGELGHIPIVGADGSSGRRCRCGNVECLEISATPQAIEHTLHDKGRSGRYEDFLNQGDDPVVTKVFADAGAALGKGISTVLDLFGPQVVVLHGPPEVLGPPRAFHIGRPELSDEADGPPGIWRAYSRAMMDDIRRHVFSTAASGCEFIVRTRSDEQGARAAAACLIRTLDSSWRTARPSTALTSAGQ